MHFRFALPSHCFTTLFPSHLADCQKFGKEVCEESYGKEACEESYGNQACEESYGSQEDSDQTISVRT